MYEMLYMGRVRERERERERELENFILVGLLFRLILNLSNKLLMSKNKITWHFIYI